MSVDKQEIISTAIKFETEGRDFYLETAKKATNPLAREMFESFARDEERHREWFEQYAKEERVTVDEPKAMFGELRKIFAEAPEDLRGKAASSEDDIKALQFAIDSETESMGAYSRWAEQVEDGELKKLCETLVEVEEGHRKVLQNVKNYLSSTCDWFMSEEQALLD